MTRSGIIWLAIMEGLTPAVAFAVIALLTFLTTQIQIHRTASKEDISELRAELVKCQTDKAEMVRQRQDDKREMERLQDRVVYLERKLIDGMTSGGTG